MFSSVLKSLLNHAPHLAVHQLQSALEMLRYLKQYPLKVFFIALVVRLKTVGSNLALPRCKALDGIIVHFAVILISFSFPWLILRIWACEGCCVLCSSLIVVYVYWSHCSHLFALVSSLEMIVSLCLSLVWLYKVLTTALVCTSWNDCCYGTFSVFPSVMWRNYVCYFVFE